MIDAAELARMREDMSGFALRADDAGRLSKTVLTLIDELEKARGEKDEAIRQSQGYLKCARECLDERDTLRARVAKLEAALEEARIDFEMWHETTSIAKIDAALKDAPGG